MKVMTLTLLYLFVLFACANNDTFSSTQEKSNDPAYVVIAPTAVIAPLDKILLVRKGQKYCSIKFSKFWTGKTESDYFAEYESYYQGDGSGDFSNSNVQFKVDKLSFPKPRGIGRLTYSVGNKEIQCSLIRLFWTGKGAVAFYGKGQEPADYGIELAPTIWNDISQVDVFDPRIQWYKYDSNRKDMKILIEQLWEDREKEK